MAAAVDLPCACGPAERCEALARTGGSRRRALAAAAGSYVLVLGWERLGFARLSDYAVERLGMSGRELQDLARVDADSLEGGSLTAEEGSDEGRRETLRLGCSPRVKVKWHRARLLASRVAGQRMAAWQRAEAVAAETLSSSPMSTRQASHRRAGFLAPSRPAGKWVRRPRGRKRRPRSAWRRRGSC